MLDLLLQFIDVVLHLDVHLDALVEDYGVWVYVILFLIVFCETGLVVLPLLPGDSLLFAAGAIAASGRLNVGLLCGLLLIAAIAGNAVNYWVGRLAGTSMQRRFPRLIRQQHLDKTRAYFERYGGKTIVYARFLPVIRTFAGVVAGVAEMPYLHFLPFSVLGGMGWVFLMTMLGYELGSVPFVRRNFDIVILGIVFVSLLPTAIEILKGLWGSWRPSHQAGRE